MLHDSIEKFFDIPQFSLTQENKEPLFIDILKESFDHHYKKSKQVQNILTSLKYNRDKITSLEEFPFFPVGIYKELELKSINNDSVIKILTSSGTTGQKVSKIFLDSYTSKLQTKALASIIASYIGIKRLPMLIIDSENILEDRKISNARVAGILGLSNFGRNHFYTLDKDMKLKKEALHIFLEQYSNQPVLLFGFTFMVWFHFIQELLKENIKVELSQGILIHSGGWKKLESMSISNEAFKAKVKEQTNIERVYNFYGMVEQVGSIYMECEEGYFHSSNFSEVIIRDQITFKPKDINEKGILQTISILPVSYPGNSILTEDEGIIYGVDDCKCGRKGTYFRIIGRIPKAELRGCSDIYADTVGGN